MEIQGTDTFIRPIYAGNAISTVKSSDPIKVFTIRAASWTAAEEGGESVEADKAAAEDVGESTPPDAP
jgi:electron transfer flavoprotein alpha subunit